MDGLKIRWPSKVVPVQVWPGANLIKIYKFDSCEALARLGGLNAMYILQV
jgi:hypothetical protein